MALDKIIAKEVGESSNMRSRLTKLDAQLKAQMNRIIEHRTDGLTFHYKAIDQVRADGQQLVNQAMGGILQDSINEMGAKAVLKGGGNPLQGVMGSLGGLQTIANRYPERMRWFANRYPERMEKPGERFPAVWQRCL
ncbi:Putative periplasmic protein [Salmonella enterica subsp. enterica serovar Wandsworth str. A4-580]|uniref:Putative periplasmic protein n=1 Tax=Salmonella enterica subsp. enterica serovar Wandsworth str. A4-580 TaxID=913086 RepID=G5SGQ6_SALET|nr:Putative periplasmic protein [Salmonella enterica subsp. enterica serovar Wandsworth str. A4-580]